MFRAVRENFPGRDRGVAGRGPAGPGEREKRPVHAPDGVNGARAVVRSLFLVYPRSHNAGTFGGSQPAWAWCACRQR
ncbi:hypothetical protein YW3DRAFT_06365 [Streptomyces sp. MnatMP-M77]|nr:hypothetical protein SACT1_4341 [Streptomyces sp. ACT-1]SBU98723.1 hypothetical protein YW3DRAFT_06365 [Streptomyces sp. MnatMP-M77]SCD74481.1 hypothetical protein GA0115261_101599 [Streptomyces sp. OspMP-M43]